MTYHGYRSLKNPDLGLRRGLMIPEKVKIDAEANAHLAEATMTRYVNAAHDFFITLGSLGVTSETKVQGVNGWYPLPTFSDETSEAEGSNVRMDIKLQPRVIEQSEPLRTKLDLSLSEHISRALRLTNMLYTIQSGDYVEISQTRNGQDYEIEMPISIPPYD